MILIIRCLQIATEIISNLITGLGAELNLKSSPEAYLGPYQTFMMERFCEIANS